MTLEDLYRPQFEKDLAEYKENMLKPLEQYRDLGELPDDIVELLTYEKNLLRKQMDLNAVSIPPMTYSAQAQVDSYYKGLEDKSEDERRKIREQYMARKNSIQSDYEQRVAKQHADIEAMINPFREKHNQLLLYKDDMQRTCKRYGISPLDMDISDDISQDELSGLIDESLSICEKYKSKDLGLFAKAIEPLKSDTTVEFVACYVLVALVLIYFALPVAAIGVFGYMLATTHNLYKDLEKLKLAVALMCQIDYNRFVSDELLVPIETPDLSSVDAEMEIALANVNDYSEERSQSVASATLVNNDVTSKCSEATKEVMDEYSDVKNRIKSKLSEVSKAIEEKMKDYVCFPNVCNQSVVMSHEYVLGRLENRLDVKAELPLSNIVFDCRDRDQAISMIKLYLCNALLSVQVKKLVVDIHDPQNQGRDFAEFFDDETMEYIRPNSKDISKLMEEFRQYTQNNINRLKHEDIDSYNRNAEATGITPLSYRLLIMISEFDRWKKADDESGRVFKEFFKYSAENGVMIWIMDTSKWAKSVWVDGNYTGDKGRALKYTMDLGAQTMNTFIHSLRNYKDRGIAYKAAFADKYIPREKWWTWNTIKGIDLHFGLEDGDPSKGYVIQLNDGSVHMLCGGATGAGKSALISSLEASLITMYPPSELEIIYIDFKNSEASKLTRNGRSIIPHFRIISGTTDGEYALSIFDYLISELTARQKICAKYKEVNLKDLRERHPEVVVPRLLVLFDEFQVMFNDQYVPIKIINQITGKIEAFTKLARAYGGHLAFFSQSMKGTMSQDVMANFSVRAALRCTPEVSESIIGNGAAGTITEKFGYMYTNTAAGTDKKFNKKWRVPFLDVPDFLKIADELTEMCKQTGQKHWNAEFYDETVLVPSTVLDNWYTNYRDKFSDPESMILGERAAYSVNRAPLVLSLVQKSKENILIGAFERADMCNLVLTVVDNIRKKENAQLIMNVADRDIHTLLGVEDLVDPDLYDISLPEQDVTEFIDAIQDVVDGRLEATGPFSPIYVLCVGWENAAGIGVEQQYKLMEKFGLLLNNAPKVGVHFVFSMESKPLEPCSSIVRACAHRLIGLMPDDSAFFTDNSAVEKLPNKDADKGLFAIYQFGKDSKKFRIYQHKFTHEIKSREIIIE